MEEGIRKLDDFFGGLDRPLGRKEYAISVILISLISSISTIIIMEFSFMMGAETPNGLLQLLNLAFMFGAIAAVSMRRFRDLGMPGWYGWSTVIPYVGFPICLTLMLVPADWDKRR